MVKTGLAYIVNIVNYFMFDGHTENYDDWLKQI